LKKVLIITYYWPPSGGPGVQRALKFVKYLPEFGMAPVVLTVDPAKASYPLTDDTLAAEIPKGTRVIRTASFEPLRMLSLFSKGQRIPHGGFANAGQEGLLQKALRYIRGNFFIPDARKGWVSFAVTAADRLIRDEQISTVFISSPPHSSQLIGLELKKRFPGLRWIADLRDPWTDIYYYQELLHRPAAARRDAAFESRVLHHADHVITVSSPIRDLLLRKSARLDAGRFHVLPNGYDEEDFPPSPPVRPSAFVVTYVGTMAASYRPAAVLRVLGGMKQRGLPVQLRMVGTHAATVAQEVEEQGLGGCTNFIPYVAHPEAVRHMQESDVLLLIIPDVEHSEGILTGKLFEYLGSRRPVLGLGPVTGEAANILEECRAGKMFGRDDEGGIREYLEAVYEKWKRGEDLANADDTHKKYSRRELTRQLAAYL
jgi:glycosyltransferase involved in cell wall biosynthesis